MYSVLSNCLIVFCINVSEVLYGAEQFPERINKSLSTACHWSRDNVVPYLPIKGAYYYLSICTLKVQL